jgi:DNA replication protein DnaC
MGTQVIVGFEKRSPCGCYAGKNQLAQWHTNNCQTCAYGWVTVVPDELRPWERYSEPCKDCAEGKRLATLIAGEKANKQQRLLEKLVAGAGLTPELKRKTFLNFDCPDDALLKACAEVNRAAIEGVSLLLIGNTGTGKSHLAAAYLNHCLATGRAGVFVSLIDLMQTLYETIANRESPVSWGEVLKRYTEADILVIDDLGQEKATEKTIEVVFHILNHRINNQRTTVVTSNRSLASLRDDKGYSPAIISRLGSYERVIWEAKDWRLKA